MKQVTLYLLFFLFLPSFFLSSQTPFYHGELRAYLSGNGSLRGPNGAPWLSLNQDDAWASLVYRTGLWVSGMDSNGALKLVDISFGGQAGPIDSDPAFNKVWLVTAAEIEAHRQDFDEDGIIDNPIEAIFSWPGRGNPYFLAYNGFELPATPNNLAPFYDLDGDNTYDPEDGDFPILSMRNCNQAIIPTQMAWAICRALTDDPEVGPLEFEVVLFSFGCEEAHPLNETIFLKYKTIFYGETPNGNLSNSRWGLYVDPDLGCPDDDYVGTFPDRLMGFAYNATNVDTSCNAYPGLGQNPPSLGVSVFRGPLGAMGQEVSVGGIRHFFKSSAGNPPPGTTDPGTMGEYYQYLAGNWLDGSPLTVGGVGLGGTIDTDFCFPGLPEQPSGWTEWEESNFLGDRRLLAYFNEFDLFAGAVNEVFAAFTMNRDGADHLDQVAGLQDQADILQAFFDNCFSTDFLNPPCTQVLTDLSEPKEEWEWQLSPNPTTGEVWLEFPNLVAGRLEVYDLTGRLLLSQREKAARMHLDLSKLPAGMYLVSFRDEKGEVFVEKLIKNQ